MNTRFEIALRSADHQWIKPIVDVVDTAHIVRMALKDWEIDDTELLLGLTKLVIQRHECIQENQSE